MINRLIALFVFTLSILSNATVMFGQTVRQPLSYQELIPPAEPAIKPLIAALGPNDLNLDKIDDTLGKKLAAAKSLAQPSERAMTLSDKVRLELIFTEQITQARIDTFIAMGGVIDHIYKSVSYGWNGSISLDKVEQLPALMGKTLAAVVAEHKAELHLKEATQNGRVRPVWVPGFAGSSSGFSGNSEITIAVIDSGVDDSHTDLSGRNEFWYDYTTDTEASPRDIIQHGSHVTGIALGTGAAIGASPAHVHFTDSGNWSSYAAGYYSPSPIHLSAGSISWTTIGTWVGGGTTFVRHRSSSDGSSTYSTFGSISGISPQTLTSDFTAASGTHYTGTVNSNGSNTYWAAAHTVTYSGVEDGYNALSGVAPSCQWAGAKVFTNSGSGSSLDIDEAVDDMVTQRVTHNIKVANMSLGIIGNPGIDTTIRAKVNTMVNNGIVAVISAGNDGPGTANTNLVDDPGRAALAITVAASNTVNELTRYTSSGFLSPGSDEDNKPDVMAPGGSDYYALILSVDSNDADAESVSFADQRSNDYYNIKGTSMASPFVAGAAALVIDAMQQSGVTWDFNSSAHPLRVKMLLLATATESNANREVSSGSNPTLGRASTPKDRFEGYGLINPDAAIEAVMLSYTGTEVSDSTNGGYYDRRAWARNASLCAGKNASLTLTVPSTADYDLYLYSGTPDLKGNPVILASSTNAGLDTDESINYTPSTTETGYLVIKRVSGNGSWTLNGTTLVDLISFSAASKEDRIELSWETGSEIDTSGFHLWRAEGEDGEYSRITNALIPSRGGPTKGAQYSYVDENVLWGETYFYKLEDIDFSGASTFHGPISVKVEGFSIALLSPGNDTYFRRTAPLTFEWADNGPDFFRLQFSSWPDFGKGTITLPVSKKGGSSWVSGNSYTPTLSEWSKVSQLGRKSKTIYWRAYSIDGSGNTIVSEPFRILMK